MKLRTALLVSLLVGSNLFWLYRWFDQVVTQAYQEHERYEAANRIVATAAVASEAVRGKSKEEAESLLKRLFPDEQVFEKEGAVRTIWLALPLTPQGKVSGIEVGPAVQMQALPKARGVVVNEVFRSTK